QRLACPRASTPCRISAIPSGSCSKPATRTTRSGSGCSPNDPTELAAHELAEVAGVGWVGLRQHVDVHLAVRLDFALERDADIEVVRVALARVRVELVGQDHAGIDRRKEGV